MEARSKAKPICAQCGQSWHGLVFYAHQLGFHPEPPAAALPADLADLTCGNGQLLYGAKNETTKSLFGWDIDPWNPIIGAPL